MSNLWIRTQHRKRLAKITDVSVRGTEVIGNWVSEKDFFLLATYRTEKRALEVLDEIQRLLMSPDRAIFKGIDVDNEMAECLKQKGLDVILITNEKEPKIETLPTNCIVYEMPAE